MPRSEPTKRCLSLVTLLPEPFDPLPVCSPGMLVGADGLPATSNPEAIEREACEILGVKDLRTWLMNKFFPFHIKRYSKSRRKAPIYWQLRSSRQNYSIFLYYHRLTKNTLFNVLRSYVDPKIQYERGKLDELKELLEAAKGRGIRKVIMPGRWRKKSDYLRN